MSQPNSGEYSVRSLAEILREHGLETELGTRPGRRRRTSDDPQATGRSPRVEPAPRPTGPNGSPVAARSATPVRTPGQVPTPARSPAGASPARVPVTTWPDQSSTGPRPAAGLTGPAAPVREPAPEVRNSPADRVPATGRGAGNAD